VNAGTAGIQYNYFYDNQVLNTAYNNNNSNYANPGNGFRLFGTDLDYIVLDTNTISSNGVGAPCSGGVSGGGNGLVYGSGLNYVTAVNNTITNNGGDAVEGSSPADSEWSGNTVSGNACQNNSASNTGWSGTNTNASFTYSPSNPSAGQTVTFTNTSTGTFQNAVWDFDDAFR
jgi:hypothetical protein